jgi:oligoribonuclease
MAQLTENVLIWVDMEMTGLNPECDAIIEFAGLATDAELNITHQFGEYVLHQPQARFNRMDDWNRRHHHDSGLWQRVVEANLTVAELEARFLSWLKTLGPAKTMPLCGNSIWQDRRFMSRYMPKVDQYLHYRTIDVSTIKELVRRWYPGEKYDKEGQHRAMGDILESVEELRYYRQKFFQKS